MFEGGNMAERDNCEHYRRHDRTERPTGKDSPLDYVKGFYCTINMDGLGGCPDVCPEYQQTES